MALLVRLGDAGGWGHMWNWGGGMMVIGWLLIVIVIGGLWLLFTMVGGNGPPEPRDPRDVLDERYARGELDRDDYLQRRADLDR